VEHSKLKATLKHYLIKSWVERGQAAQNNEDVGLSCLFSTQD
jgi:hypothetical protein